MRYEVTRTTERDVVEEEEGAEDCAGWAAFWTALLIVSVTTGAGAVLGLAASAESLEPLPGTTGAGAGTTVVWVLGP